MASNPEDYPTLPAVTKNDLDLMRQQAQKAQALNKSPHTEPHVLVRADVLLWMLEKLERQVR